MGRWLVVLVHLCSVFSSWKCKCWSAGAQEYRTTARHDAVDHDSQPNLNPPWHAVLHCRRAQTVHRLLHCTALRRRRRVDCSSDGSEICDRFMPGQLSRITRLQYVWLSEQKMVASKIWQLCRAKIHDLNTLSVKTCRQTVKKNVCLDLAWRQTS